MNCLLIINKLSGNAKHADQQVLKRVFGVGYDTEVFFVNKNNTLPDLTKFDKIVACGGDGTLNHLINQQTKSVAKLIYCPYGTLNEVAKCKDKSLQTLGKANDKKFGYVLATGIFAPLGYKTKDKQKQKFKAFAYLFNVIKQYKIHRISATLQIDGNLQQGEYTLLMAIDSPTCFGFKFNKAYQPNDDKMHLLAIRAPKRNNIFCKIKIFFPLFRAFFVGFKKEYHSKNMSFVPFEKLTITLDRQTDFCMDGEYQTFDGKIDISTCKATNPIAIVCKKDIKKAFKQGTNF